MAKCEVCGSETARVTVGGQLVGALCQIALARLASTPGDPMIVPDSYFQVEKNK